jgi:hypothetical protein
VRVTIRNGDDDGDPGAIAEAYYTIEDGVVVLRDHDDTHLTSGPCLRARTPQCWQKACYAKSGRQRASFHRPISYPNPGIA